MEFKNKVVLITGSSRGIGKAIAQAFAKEGAKIVINYNKNSVAAKSTLSSLASNNHLIIQANISDPNAIKIMVDKTIQHYGKIDILINNAGVYTSHPIASVNYETWQKEWHNTININLIAAANTSYCVAQHMIKAGGGRIVNISSRGAFRGEPNSVAYGASKAGLNAMSQSMAKELAQYNIFVGVVAPGFVETDMAASILTGPNGDAIRNQSPLGRVAKPDEVAKATLFLASKGTEFMTGTIIDVNGASYLR